MYNKANIYKAMYLPKAEIERIKCAMSYHEYKMKQCRDRGEVEGYMLHAKRATKYVQRIAEIMAQEV